MSARPITFLTDYGRADDFVGVCHAVIAGIAPTARVIDLTHDIAPFDLAAGARMLRRSLRFTPPGVHLAVVDPGVGGSRRAVAVAAADEQRVFVGPDNGVLWPALQACGGAVAAVEISASPVRLEPVSATFHGRDLFAPVAAHLAIGARLEELGEPLEPGSLVALQPGGAAVSDGHLEGAVVGVDRFGNVSVSAGGGALSEAGFNAGDAVDVLGVPGLVGRTFSDVATGVLLVHLNSWGEVEVAVNGGSAAERLGGLTAGAPVTIARR